MAEFWSDEWFAAVNAAADGLPSIDGLSFSFDVEVAESPAGKVRAHGQMTDGRLSLFAPGKFVPEVKGQKADVSLVGKAKRLLPIVTGDQPALVAYMLGELKVEGEYQLVVDDFANRCDAAAVEQFRSDIAAATTL